MSFYSKCYKLFAGALRCFYNIRVIGSENEPETGAVIAASNHLSNHDVIVVAASLKRQVRFLAKAELFKIPLLKQLITALGAFPVDRKAKDVGAIKKTIALLEAGELVGFYPQGKRYSGKEPKNTETKNGIGMVAYRSHATVLPMSIITKNNKIVPFRPCYVVIGKPISFAELEMTDGNTAEYTRVSNFIFSKICEPFERREEIIENYKKDLG